MRAPDAETAAHRDWFMNREDGPFTKISASARASLANSSSDQRSLTLSVTTFAFAATGWADLKCTPRPVLVEKDRGHSEHLCELRVAAPAAPEGDSALFPRAKEPVVAEPLKDGREAAETPPLGPPDALPGPSPEGPGTAGESEAAEVSVTELGPPAETEGDPVEIPPDWVAGDDPEGPSPPRTGRWGSPTVPGRVGRARRLARTRTEAVGLPECKKGEEPAGAPGGGGCARSAVRRVTRRATPGPAAGLDPTPPRTAARP